MICFANHDIIVSMKIYIDLRKLNNDELYELRKKIVHLKRNGYKGLEIEKLTGVRSNRISEIWRRYLEGGVEGLKPEKPGQKPGGKMLLSTTQEHGIRRTLIDSTPDSVDMPYSLWTHQIVSDFIKSEYGVTISLRSMTNYFKRWGFTCQAPAKGAAAKKSVDFMRFMSETYPAIVRRAGFENVGIYWYCEAWVPREFPSNGNIRQSRVKMAAAVTARGTSRFMFFDRRVTQEEFITLISRLIRYADRKVFVIAPDTRRCCGKKVRSWLKNRENRIEVFYHPAL